MPHTETLALILGGGVGARLYPLTKERAKPAVPMAGNYRLVDVPISNCLNSGIEKIYLLTQYNSVSLHRHISQTYKFDQFSRGWVQILAAEQTPRSADWYQGTADAIRKQRMELETIAPDFFLILSGDHLYRMDYAAFVRAHRETDADVTLAVLPVSRHDAGRFGIMETDADGRILRFYEKPKDDALLDRLGTYPNPDRPYLGSMGVYVFRADTLYRLLDSNPGSDFGKDIIPSSLQSCRVMAYPFDGYWEDIGTIKSFYEANLALVEPDALFNLHDPDRPIFTHPRFLPPAQVSGICRLEASLLAPGTHVLSSEIDHSIVGVRGQVGPAVRLVRTIMMGADYLESDSQKVANMAHGRPNVGIGANCNIEGAIIDKNARIGASTLIRFRPDRPDIETANFVVRDGIVIVLKNGSLEAGTVI
jgi:glucose-1-phosphate adenylyltransferase